MDRMKSELATTMNELQTFRNYREKQNVVIETITEQRDTYKRFLADMELNEVSG